MGVLYYPAHIFLPLLYTSKALFNNMENNIIIINIIGYTDIQ